MAKVTFDYSKAESFISNDEVNSMKEIAENAKKVLVERTGAGNDFLDGLICRLIMIKKNLTESRKQQQRFRAIQKYLSL
jgi:hypothetical protein